MSNKRKRNLFFIASMLFSFAIPAIATIIKYDMHKAYMQASTKVQISIIGCLVVAIVALCNIKKIKEYIESIEFSVWKCVISGIFKIIPLACLALVLANMITLIDDLKYIVYVSLTSNVFSLFIFDPLWRYYNEETKYDKTFNAQHKREMLIK